MAAMGAMLLLAMLVATIWLTRSDGQWTVFLYGVLAAAIIAFASHAANARWARAKHAAELEVALEKLGTESRLRAHAEGELARQSNSVQSIDEALPAMLASDAPETTAPGAGERLVSALEHDEFALLCQPIVALHGGAPEAAFCEVLLRMREEEELLLPPGTFLPVAEELGLLHVVDRWVVRHVVGHAATARAHRDAVYFVNLSAPTIRDSGFAQFVRECLRASRVPDQTLCFELPEADVLADPAAYREFIGGLDGTGCRFAVSGSACDPDSVRLFADLRMDFLKLDGGIVVGMLRTTAGLARVEAINEAAHAAGMRVVAECVEDDGTRAELTRIGIDFAQGFGIGMPRPIRALDDELALAEAARVLELAAA